MKVILFYYLCFVYKNVVYIVILIYGLYFDSHNWGITILSALISSVRKTRETIG